MHEKDEPQALTITLDAELVAALDRFITELHPESSREAVAELALREWASQHGYTGTRAPIRPEDLNASNDD